MTTIDKLIQKVKSYYPAADKELLRRAFDFAFNAHQGQHRRSGEDYIVHPLEVAMILAQLQLDEVTIAAALLHDVAEDTKATLEDIEREFGSEIALLVDGVTKLSRIESKTKQEQRADNLRKMFLAMAKDIRVILIKLADRLHNMRTLKYQSSHKQKEIAEDTLEIFAPLAHRLGIFELRWQLEDLALRYLHPEEYYDLVQKINKRRQERERDLEKVIAVLKDKLEEMGIEAEIEGRPKHLYSIYNKIHQKGRELSEIYDLIAVRVIVDSIKDCYAVLGIVHTLWKPIPGRFKDYIAMPKPNMYQSLHTTVIASEGEPFEIQIRTSEMHRTAEYGIAAHWRYKEGKEGKEGPSDFENRLSWLRQVLEWQQETKDSLEFMDSLKVDLFSDRVYVFTPKGNVVELPAGSVPLDFAYKVHTEVGHQCVGAKVNGRLVPLNYKLRTGDIVEIITRQGSTPSRDWINIVRSSQAKNKIRTWFRKKEQEESQSKGRELLEKECKKQGLDTEKYLKAPNLAAVAKRFNLAGAEDLYSALASGVITSGNVLSKLKEEVDKVEKTEKEKTEITLAVPVSFENEVKPKKSKSGVRVEGLNNAEVRLARCCSPLPGDEIVGYITRGRGVSVHRSDCPNALYHMAIEKERFLDVSWEEVSNASYQLHLEIDALDRPNLTVDIMNAVQDTKTTINSVHARATKDKRAFVDLKVEIQDLEQVHYIMEKVSKVRDVQGLRRVTPH